MTIKNSLPTKKARSKRSSNLNEFQLENDGNYPENFIDNSIIKKNREIQVFFRNIREYLIKEIKKADVIVGCVAWLTDPEILEALAKKSNVCIIVQKEDFLKPDIDVEKISSKNWQKKWKEKIRDGYNKLNCKLERTIFPNILSSVTTHQISTFLNPVRCVGNYNRAKRPAFPRMHNKFLIFAKYKDKNRPNSNIYDTSKVKITPYAVWTGSFNLTKTAGQSLENALLIKDIEIVNAYFQEFGQICAMSEPLDWESDWVAPEWRIGS